MSIAIPLLISGASAAGNIYAAHKSSKAWEDVRQSMDNRYNDLESLMNYEQNQNALDTKESQAALSRVREQMQDMMAGFRNNAVSNQSTPEAQVAAGGQMSRGYGDAVSQILSAAEGKKDAKRMHRESMLNSLFNNQMGLQMQQASVWDTLSNNFSQAGAGALDAYGAGAFDKKVK